MRLQATFATTERLLSRAQPRCSALSKSLHLGTVAAVLPTRYYCELSKLQVDFLGAVPSPSGVLDAPAPQDPNRKTPFC